MRQDVAQGHYFLKRATGSSSDQAPASTSKSTAETPATTFVTEARSKMVSVVMKRSSGPSSLSERSEISVPCMVVQ